MENRNRKTSNSYKYVDNGSQGGSNLSDNELLDLIANGNKNAFGILYERYVEAIYRYILFQVGRNTHVAEDLTEDVFLRAFKLVLKKRKKNASFKALVYRIAHNLVIDRYRTHKTSVSIEQVEELKDGNPHPESVMQTKELSEELAQAVSQLKPKMQKVIILRYVVGANTAETAEIMGITESYVRVLQFRALNALRLEV
jgi:RNA polymerase sigma-70 factor (ECF subfamily)